MERTSSTLRLPWIAWSVIIDDVGSTKSVKAIVPMPLMTPESPMAVRATADVEHRREIRCLDADGVDAHDDDVENQQPLWQRAPVEARAARAADGHRADRSTSRITGRRHEPRKRMRHRPASLERVDAAPEQVREHRQEERRRRSCRACRRARSSAAAARIRCCHAARHRIALERAPRSPLASESGPTKNAMKRFARRPVVTKRLKSEIEVAIRFV